LKKKHGNVVARLIIEALQKKARAAYRHWEQTASSSKL